MQGTPGGIRFVPRFSLEVPLDPPTYVQFSTWWVKESIYTVPGGAGELSRRRMVFALRHQDGGGHIGQLTDDLYVRLKAGGGYFTSGPNGASIPMPAAIPATMRQIAWEVEETLKEIGEIV
jgi:hypothetical protein